MKALYVTWIISLPHATRIIKKLNSKKHAALGYCFEIQDLGITLAEAELSLPTRCYNDYGIRSSRKEPAFLLHVYREV